MWRGSSQSCCATRTVAASKVPPAHSVLACGPAVSVPAALLVCRWCTRTLQATSSGSEWHPAPWDRIGACCSALKCGQGHKGARFAKLELQQFAGRPLHCQHPVPQASSAFFSPSCHCLTHTAAGHCTCSAMLNIHLPPRFTAVGLTPQPADQALFFCNFKQPAADGSTGAEISVAYYFEHLANPRQPLRYPQLPGEAGLSCTGGWGPMSAAQWQLHIHRPRALQQSTFYTCATAGKKNAVNSGLKLACPRWCPCRFVSQVLV